MANLASLAAAKSATLGKGGKPQSSGLGGIAGLAAAAAAKSKPAPAGGIAALAAAAASKKAGPPMGTGIAGLAAAAAKKKPAAPSAGGIAGLAAAAAAAKMKPAGVGGIAGLAAAAAQSKKPTSLGLAAMAAQSKTKSDAAPPAGGIAGLAAAAAAAKQKPTPAGGIAGLAALAAQSKKPTTSLGLAAMAAQGKTKSDAAPPAGGIAGLAAAAAATKQKPVPAGGLAALAAASKKKKPELTRQSAGGSIGGLAAMAAMSKEEDRSLAPLAGDSVEPAVDAAPEEPASTWSRTTNGRLSRQELSEEESPPAPSTGGIAELAAAAAKSKSDTVADNDATLAAPAPDSRGIEASLSDSPRKRKVYDEKSGLYGGAAHASPSSAEFKTPPDGTVFQMGSPGLALPRIKPRRRKSGDGSTIFRPRRKPVTRSKSDAATRNWANLQSDVSDELSTTEGGWLPKSTTFPVEGGPTESGPPEIARSQSQGGESTAAEAPNKDDFMAALGWGDKGDDDNDEQASDPSINFTMRRAPRKGRNSDAFNI